MTHLNVDAAIVTDTQPSVTLITNYGKRRAKLPVDIATNVNTTQKATIASVANQATSMIRPRIYKMKICV